MARKKHEHIWRHKVSLTSIAFLIWVIGMLSIIADKSWSWQSDAGINKNLNANSLLRYWQYTAQQNSTSYIEPPQYLLNRPGPALIAPGSKPATDKSVLECDAPVMPPMSQQASIEAPRTQLTPSQNYNIKNLQWKQRVIGTKFNFFAGEMDIINYLNICGIVTPETSFGKRIFNSEDADYHLKNSYGAAFGTMATDKIYLTGVFTNTPIGHNEKNDMFSSFFDEQEFFSHLELGWRSSYKRLYFDNIHLSGWHADQWGSNMTLEGWGVALSLTTFISGEWMPFLRAGISDNGKTFNMRSISAGVGRYWADSRHIVNSTGDTTWSETTSWSTSGEQYAMEIYYRFDVTANLSITPDVQIIIDPYINPEENTLILYGLRAMVSL